MIVVLIKVIKVIKHTYAYTKYTLATSIDRAQNDSIYDVSFRAGLLYTTVSFRYCLPRYVQQYTTSWAYGDTILLTV